MLGIYGFMKRLERTYMAYFKPRESASCFACGLVTVETRVLRARARGNVSVVLRYADTLRMINYILSERNLQGSKLTHLEDTLRTCTRVHRSVPGTLYKMSRGCLLPLSVF